MYNFLEIESLPVKEGFLKTQSTLSPCIYDPEMSCVLFPGTLLTTFLFGSLLWPPYGLAIIHRVSKNVPPLA